MSKRVPRNLTEWKLYTNGHWKSNCKNGSVLRDQCSILRVRKKRHTIQNNFISTHVLKAIPSQEVQRTEGNNGKWFSDWHVGYYIFLPQRPRTIKYIQTEHLTLLFLSLMCCSAFVLLLWVGMDQAAAGGVGEKQGYNWIPNSILQIKIYPSLSGVHTFIAALTLAVYQVGDLQKRYRGSPPRCWADFQKKYPIVLLKVLSVPTTSLNWNVSIPAKNQDEVRLKHCYPDI